MTDFTEFLPTVQPEQFHAVSYDGTLEILISHVLIHEAPILDSVLVQRIARAHGFRKSGRLIRERVLDIVDRHYHFRADPVGGSFVWADADAPLLWSRYRIPASDEDLRKIEEIPFEELRAAAAVSSGEDLAVEVARLFGIRRLAAGSRERLEAVLQLETV